MKIVTLSITWWGQPRPPQPGDFIKTASGRTAYEVLEFKPRRPGSKTYGTVRCMRRSPVDIADGAPVWPWEWSRR